VRQVWQLFGYVVDSFAVARWELFGVWQGFVCEWRLWKLIKN
jgi:hypothetical protein